MTGNAATTVCAFGVYTVDAESDTLTTRIRPQAMVTVGCVNKGPIK